MNQFVFGFKPSHEMRFPSWLLEDIGCHPYKQKQPNGYSDLEKDWLSTELVIRRLMYAKKAFHQYKVADQIDDTIHERIIRTNFDNPEKLVEVSKELGEPMVGLNIDDLDETEKLAKRGW